MRNIAGTPKAVKYKMYSKCVERSEYKNWLFFCWNVGSENSNVCKEEWYISRNRVPHDFSQLRPFINDYKVSDFLTTTENIAIVSKVSNQPSH